MTVTDAQMIQGSRLAFERFKMVVELSAGAAVGAAVSPKFKEKFLDVKRVGVILSGGNISPENLVSTKSNK
jgi:threonine dehydratase